VSCHLSVTRVAAGAVCRRLLAEFGIRVGSYVTAIGGVAPSLDSMPLIERLENAAALAFSCPSPEAAGPIRARIAEAARSGDTLGGTFEVAALGVPPGLGSHVHWDRRLTARLGEAALSVPGVKGVEIGEAFANADRLGSETHDGITAGLRVGSLTRSTNRAGGIEGGISSVEPIVLRAAMKPVATLRRPIESVDLRNGSHASPAFERSDICAVPRAAVVVEAMVCIVLADALLEKTGGDSLAEIRPRVASLATTRADLLAGDDRPTVLWS
jgi:chorismate synthase